MKKQLHFYLIAIMLTFGFNVGAQVMDADYFNFKTSATSDWSYTNSGVITFAEVSEDIATASSGKCMKFEVKHDMTSDDKKQVATSNLNKGGTLTLVEGKTYKLSLRVFLGEGADKAYFSKVSCAMKKSSGGTGYMNFPALNVTSSRGVWQELESSFTYAGTDNEVDQEVSSTLVINLNQTTLTGSEDGLMYIDDILIEEVIPDETVTFLIQDTEGNPIESANVTINGETLSSPKSTDDVPTTGIVEFNVPQGTYTVAIARNAYDLNIIEDFVVSDNMPQEVVTLQAGKSAQIIVEAKDATGEVLKGAMVISKDKNGVEVYVKETNNGAGRVWIGGLGEDTYTYELFGTNTLSGTVDFTATNRTVRVQESMYNVNLAVINYDSGIDIKTAIVSLTDGAGNDVSLTQVDAEFYHNGDALTPGTFSYTVNADGFNEATGSFVLADMNNIDLRYIKLEETSTNISNPSDFDHAVYPNPATSVVNVAAPAGSVVSFYSISGNKAKVINTTSELTSISVTDLAKGLYIVEIVSEGSKIIEKIQIQ